jgi:hypothetical protein
MGVLFTENIMKKQSGFHLVIIVIIVAVVVVGVLLWVFLGRSMGKFNPNDVSSVTWQFDGELWKPSGTPPACEEPLLLGSPIDVTKASAVLMPGQVRGTDFKPHGGLARADAEDNSLTVVTMRDAYLYRASRYTVEAGQVQYLFDFMDPCGIMFRFDHLATLTDQFQEYANTLPEPTDQDSRTYPMHVSTLIPKGTVVATEVGIREGKNVFFDVGVYDLRTRNEASKTELYKTDSLRIADKEQSFFALCWFDFLNEKDKAIVKALPSRDGVSGYESDYCTN